VSVLRLERLTKHFGGMAAVEDVSFSVEAGEVFGLIGPNGSGKTTLLNILSGFLPLEKGEVWLEDKAVTGMKPVGLARRGLGRMFQASRVFLRMSAVDNLVTAGLAMGLDQRESARRAGLLLEELTLSPVRYMNAGQLSGGQRKLLDFGMCFIQRPRIALLDEPFAAVHPVMRETMASFIRRHHAQGQTFLVVSHDMPIVVELCQRAACMNAGRLMAMGTPREVLQDRGVIEAYLGGSQDG
jgi:branched-chain amino acid transport system ATP-binding protein